MKRILFLAAVLAVGFCAVSAFASDDPLFHSTDTLAPRDDLGKLHQSPETNSTDYEHHLGWRPLYYFHSGRYLSTQPAYVGALQSALRRYGYYCGPIDGVFSDDLSDAIARMQKNYSMRVTGTLTIAVRRALYLP